MSFLAVVLFDGFVAGRTGRFVAGGCGGCRSRHSSSRAETITATAG